jgi:hypothetical protein
MLPARGQLRIRVKVITRRFRTAFEQDLGALECRLCRGCSPYGRAMFTIGGAVPELETSLISERVTAGMQAARSRGKHLGRRSLTPRRPWRPDRHRPLQSARAGIAMRAGSPSRLLPRSFIRLADRESAPFHFPRRRWKRLQTA